MRRPAAILLLVLLSSASAQEVNISFVDWQKLSQVARAAYLAGIIDTSYAEPLEEKTHRFHRCVQKEPRPLARLADDILTHARRAEAGSQKPKFRTVHEALQDYLRALCPSLY
jgi:Skp family chaperone for outer membrane proteins